MTVRSAHSAFIRFAATTLDTYEGVDTGLVRVCRNNLLHALDSHGQVLENWSMPASIHVFATSSDWEHAYTGGAHPVRLDENGQPFPLRVRIAGRIASAGTSDFRIAVTTPRNAPERWLADVESAGANTADASSSSTTSAWLAMSTEIVTFPANRVEKVAVTTLLAVGGAPVTLQIPMVRIVVAGTGDAGGVTGVYAAEYCGGP